MAINFVDSSLTSVSATLSFELSLPTTVEDDIVVVCVGAGLNGNENVGVSTSGYTEVVDLYASNIRETRLSISWKRMGSTPDTSVTCIGVSSEQTAAIAYVLRGVDSTVLDVAVQTATGASAIPDCPSITTVTEGALVLICGASVSYDASVTVPTTFDNQIQIARYDLSYPITMAVASRGTGAPQTLNPDPWTDWDTSSFRCYCAATLAFRPETFVSPPKFEPAELVPPPIPDPNNDFSGHWHNTAKSDATWEFVEQPDLPIPYHKDPVEPKICGHWHKQLMGVSIPCIEYVGTKELDIVTSAHGVSISNDQLIWFENNLFVVDSGAGRILKLSANSLAVLCDTTFDVSDISFFRQLEIWKGQLYTLVRRSGYQGKWIQKLTVPDDGEDFELIGEPLYAGTVIYGTDGKIYGSHTCGSLTEPYLSIYTPITGDSWELVFEELPTDYGYYIYNDIGTLAATGELTSGAICVNFRIIDSENYILNSGPKSTSVGTTAAVSNMKFTGERNWYYFGNTIVGPNEACLNLDRSKAVVVRCTSAFSNLTMKVMDTGTSTQNDYSITGLLDGNGLPYDGSIYHHRTEWYTNDRIYTFHSTYPDYEGRIVSISPSGTLIHQYVFDTGTGKASFVIMGDYVYVWQDSVSQVGYISSIVKLTLDLEFVCIKKCLGKFYIGSFYEAGRSITDDSNQYIYNLGTFSPDTDYSLVTKYVVDPVLITGNDSAHDPRWDFEKQLSVD